MSFFGISASSTLSRILNCTLPGVAGGLTLFLDGLRRGHYKNDKYRLKASIEIAGAAIVASFLGYYLFGDKPLASFAIGLGWSTIVQTVRKKITRLVQAALGESFDA